MRAVLKRPLYERALMAGRLPRVAGRRHPTSRALARTLLTSALGRLPVEEREWIDRVEARRRELADDRTVVPLGLEGNQQAAPGGGDDSAPISAIAGFLSIPPRWGRFLLRLVRELAPQSCLELGTGLGISTAYQAAALELNGSGRLTTLESAPNYAAIAEHGLSALGLAARARVEVGPIDDTLPDILARAAPIDFAYLDADHTEEATVRHFDAVLPHLSAGAIVVLDDISFTSEMWNAWIAIGRRDRVSTSLALNRMGVVAVR
jgi:predicted O-methyltransferase YrrM